MRYFLAALAVGPTVLPKLPVLGITATAFLALAIFHAPLWIAGVLPVLGLAAMLAANSRFQSVVDARAHAGSTPGASEDEYTRITSQIKIETRSRLKILERKAQKIFAAQREAGVDEFTLDANDDAVRQLLLIYAKILLSRQQLLTEDFSASITRTQSEIESVETNLQDDTNTEAERASLAATLPLLQSRAHSLRERQQKLEEFDSDLQRIEAHFDLSLSQASMRDRPQGIATDIGLASSGLNNEVGGGVISDAQTGSTPSTAQQRFEIE